MILHWLVIIALLYTWPVLAQQPALKGNLIQGGLVFGRVAPGTKVEFDDRFVRTDGNGNFIIGFGRDFPLHAPLIWHSPDGKKHSKVLVIKSRKYALQRINGLAKKMVSPPAKVLHQIREENKTIAKIRLRNSPSPWFASGFNWPLKGKISGVYGSRRILNGKPRRPHYGIDIAASEGTPVYASTDGLVALAEKNFYFTGGTVMLDHGHGLTSVYSHLKSITVRESELIQKGQKIGTVGATGRATGPHLDWRLNWFKQRLDPALLVGHVRNR